MNSLSFNALFILLLINLNILCSQDNQIGKIDSYMLAYNIISQKNISNLKQTINDHVFYTNNGKWTTTTPFIIEYTPSGFKSTITNTLSRCMSENRITSRNVSNYNWAFMHNNSQPTNMLFDSIDHCTYVVTLSDGQKCMRSYFFNKDALLKHLELNETMFANLLKNNITQAIIIDQ